MKPATQYTKSGHINIAYQVYGSGPIDLVYIPGWVSNIDWMWACPELVHFFEEVGKFARLILFDKRGTGLSDRIVELSTIEERMDDIRAVMDAVGSPKAVLFGHSEGGSVSALFAATYPNRTISLITFGAFAKRRYSPDYPWAPTDEERQKVYEMIENSWGSGEMRLESLAPSLANDRVFMDWLANYFRSGASPSAAMVLTKMNTEVDIVDILGSIKVPTLLMQRTHDVDVKIEEGRFIADRIEDSIFVEFEGSDHLFWAGNTEEVLEEIRAFVTHVIPKVSYQKRLLTILTGRVIPSDDMSHQEIVGQFVGQHRGSIIQFDQGVFIAAFEGPNKAVHCSLDLQNAVKGLALELAIGIHILEGAVDQVHFVRDETELLVNEILKHTQPNQILITQTVKHLLSGAGLNFVPHTSVFETVLGEKMLLFDVKDNTSADKYHVDFKASNLDRRGSFLENVLESIEENISNECFGVEMLCREVGVSERQLQRKLKAITNKSPNQLISSVRLHRAKELILGHHDYNITEIAFKMGFSNPSYFSKCFKKEFGLSPSDFLQNQSRYEPVAKTIALSEMI
ncbi:Pimeloyl-ACP methyl ester carboxylesterase [Reichenbachiella agariperforans]|uniref:Pimeloyl-ACP methyl ester carboxylesterase n=1 Tax=Reichenbachiella agariperforans TaxID=156994 RepID=A0A1M6JP40_REIAG|nr:alpha/beta fold hydrolase [Reichenbachiella agariperforans]SHJ48406.1 Pimeloyl-ACP methyl ester carboxylesterase [Reichenbachiella agariperforans]